MDQRYTVILAGGSTGFEFRLVLIMHRTYLLNLQTSPKVRMRELAKFDANRRAGNAESLCAISMAARTGGGKGDTCDHGGTCDPGGTCDHGLSDYSYEELRILAGISRVLDRINSIGWTRHK